MTMIAQILNTNMSTKLKWQSCLHPWWHTVRINTCHNSVCSISVSNCFCASHQNKSVIHYSQFHRKQYCLQLSFRIGINTEIWNSHIFYFDIYHHHQSAFFIFLSTCLPFTCQNIHDIWTYLIIVLALLVYCMLLAVYCTKIKAVCSINRKVT
jgi:hypothetical protein